MPNDTGTNHSTGDSISSRPGPLAGWRSWLPLLCLTALALAGTGWAQWRAWRELDRLGREVSALDPNRFLLGRDLREGVRRLDILLLRFHLTGASGERDRFHETARKLTSRISLVAAGAEGEAPLAVAAVGEELNRYLNRAAELLEQSLRGVRRDAVAEVQARIDDLSSPLLLQIDRLILIQEGAWDSFAARSRGAVDAIRRLSTLTLALALLVILLVAALLNRLRVAPLVARLRQSRAAEERQEKLASLGVLAAGVAHELRNPLTAIKFRLFSHRQSLPVTMADNEDLAVVEGEVRRLERIAGEFLQFARPGEPRWAELTSSALIEETAGLVSGEIKRRGLVLRIEPGEPVTFKADRQQLQQVLINLVHNAGDSTPRGGTITLRARSGAAKLSGRSRAAVWLEVADTGSGIPPEAERRLFDPFFSTKPGGTGLGLSIAARIVEGHGGTIQYVTERGRGTTFSVVLPRGEEHESENTADRG